MMALTWKGGYAPGTAYIVDDLVESAGSTFICTSPSTGNDPAADESHTYFDLFASKGATGETGAAGADGADGATGAAGAAGTNANIQVAAVNDVTSSAGAVAVAFTNAVDAAEFVWTGKPLVDMEAITTVSGRNVTLTFVRPDDPREIVPREPVRGLLIGFGISA